MPLSTNAPFSEFGHSMVLRDLEQIYLLLGGQGTGSPADGGTQDQAAGVTQETGDSGSIPDLSRYATQDYVDNKLIGIANGGTGAQTAAVARVALGLAFGRSTVVTTAGSGSFIVPAGVTRICVNIIGGGGSGDNSIGSSTAVATILYADGVISGGSGGSIIAAFDVTPGESFSYTCGAKGGVSAQAGNSTFSGTGINLTAGGGNYGYRSAGGGPGYGGSFQFTALSASRNPIAFGFRGHAGGCSGYITAGAVTVQPSSNTGGPATAVMCGGGYAASAILPGTGTWTSTAADGQVVILY